MKCFFFGKGKIIIINYEVSSYRWVVLVPFILITMVTQLIWITFAPIQSEAAQIYTNGNQNLILILAVSWMILYIPVNYPASWLIDKYGLRWGTGIGVILTGVFGILRAFAPNYTVLLIFQILAGIGQPFVENSATKCAANWFPEKEKTLATGLAIMALLFGIIFGMMLTPFLYNLIGIKQLLMVYGLVSLVAMILYLILVKDKPPHPPNAYAEKTKVLALDGLKRCFKNKNFIPLLILLFIGLGTFNAISSDIDQIFAKYSNILGASGIIGGVMMIGGIIGSVVFSALSDKYHKRVVFVAISMGSAAVLLPLIYFLNNFALILVLDIIFGFLLVSAMPVGLTYAAEITYPITEETSNGLLVMMGQVGGIVLVIPLSFNINLSMIAFAILFAIGFIITLRLKDIDQIKLKEQIGQKS